MRYPILLCFFMMGILLVPVLSTCPSALSCNTPGLLKFEQGECAHVDSEFVSETQTGILNPVAIEHNAASAGPIAYSSNRTDITPTPSGELFLPSGPTGNLLSVDCTGGYFRVGTGGSTSFASSAGTISLWLKFDTTGPNGRFWGQDGNFETRWSSNQLVLDWGSDNTLTGTKSSWLTDHWYFIAITWDDSLNTLTIYWGDEENQPVVDVSSSSWTYSVVGHLTENDIMNSRNGNYRVDGHVDDFRYYSIQRDLNELRSDYKISLTGSETGLIHYYRFENSLDDSSGTSSLISSGSYSYSQDVFSGDDGWKAEHIEVDVKDIERIYALYGSFDSGVQGTATDWNGDASCYPLGWRARRVSLNQQDFQRVSYSASDPKYVVLENEGYNTTLSYRHYNSTTIYWYQLIDNSQQNDQFEFSMAYLYQRGPIGGNYSGIFAFSFQILNGSSILWNWSIDPTNITERGIWTEINPVTVDLPEGLSTFEVRVCLSINTNTSYIDIPYNDPDLDGVTDNGRFITFQVDDISLTALQKPSPKHVDLQVHFQAFGDISIQGENGIGSLVINCSYWDKAFIPYTFSSNTTISFGYLVRISKMTKFYNSSYSTSLDNVGVSYEVELGQSGSFFLYTYIESYSEVGNLGFTVHYPHDWFNPAVEDPFGNDITSQLVIGSDLVEIPIGVANLVGWWKIRLNGPNYAFSISAQVLNQNSQIWENETICRNGDRVRCKATIGFQSNLIDNISRMDIDWYHPSGSLWWSDPITNWNSTEIVTNGTTLGSLNATIGLWIVTVSWCNGTELAYSYASFELHHTLTVFAQTPNTVLDPNKAFTAAINIYDHDNGIPILNDASVYGNWSESSVQFSPNLAKGWWEADFNSSSIGTGNFVIMIVVSILFYDTTNCSINVNIPAAESLFIITARATLLGALAVFALFVVITISRRFYNTFATRRNVELLSLKARLEDARNLIGILVIHRSIGLPIYSCIIKGGFQESILSSFITALSQFRAEFSWDQPKWKAIPITEVITAVQTEVLICAMITVDTASDRQKNQLEMFGKDIGRLYDLDNGEMKRIVNNRELDESIDPIFNLHFDGALLFRYVGVMDTLPKHLDSVRTAMMNIDLTSGATPEVIIKAMILLGYSDRKAHNLVLEAIDEGYLVSAERTITHQKDPDS
jgi:hypothetical protein